LERSFELIVAASIFFAGLWGGLYYLRGHEPYAFYQEYFGPALFLACKGKMIQPDAATLQLEQVRKFLTAQTGSFDCKNLPEQAKDTPLPGFSIPLLYLLAASGSIWSVTGISWASLNYLAAAFAGAFAVAIYGLCRLFLPLPWAVAATVFAFVSASNMEILPKIRDYSKAPFIVGIMFFAGLLLKYSASRKSVILSAVAAGLTAGLGFGFRTDLLLAVPFFFFVLGLFIVRTRLRELGLAALCALAFGASSAVVSAPVLSFYRGGGMIGHVALLGLTTPFNHPLGLTDPAYDIGDIYLDQDMHRFTQQYAAMATRDPGMPPDVGFPYDRPDPDGSKLYARYSLNGMVEFAKQFPADIVVRITTSILHILNSNAPGCYIFADCGLVTFAIAIAIIAAIDPIMAVFFAAAGVYFGGSLALQFDPRHAFYLEFVVWLAAAIVLRWASSLLWGYLRPSRVIGRDESVRALPNARIPAVAGMLAIVVSAILLWMVSIWGVRAYQQVSIRGLFERYLSADRQPVNFEEIKADGTVLLKPVGTVPDMNGKTVSIDEAKFNGFYLVLTLDEKDCDASEFAGTFVYRKTPYLDLSRTLRIPLRSKESKSYILVPVIDFVSIPAHFEGIEMAADKRACLTNLEAIGHSRSLPLPLVLRLEPRWEEAPLYQQFRRTPFSSATVVSAVPSDLLTTLDTNNLKFTPLQSTDWQEIVLPAKAAGTNIMMRGESASVLADVGLQILTPLCEVFHGCLRRYMIAARSKSMRLSLGALVVAEGNVGYGGATVNLVDAKTGKPLAGISIDDPGAFRAILEVPQSGEYRIDIYNKYSGFGNSVKFTKVGVSDRRSVN
jgi:hypothetical protein